MKIKTLTLIITALSIFSSVRAQDKITVRDAREINVKAEDAIRGLAGLLNFISTPGVTKSEIAAAIDSSYMASNDKLFYDNKVIFENDIDPAADMSKPSDVPLEKYLNDLDIKYVKAIGSIKFNINRVSAIKFKDFLFIRVKFDSEFGSKCKVNQSIYTVKQREAIVRLERGTGKNWNAYIAGVNFYDPSNSIDSATNNVPVNFESQTISSDSLALIIKRDSAIRADSIRRVEMMSENYVKSADSLVKIRQFPPALEILEKAKELIRFSPQITIKISYVKGEIAKNTYKNYKNKGDDAKGKHQYLEAIQFYRRANNLRGESDVSLLPDVDALSKLLSIIDYPKNILQTGEPENAIKECERVFKENKSSKNDYPELYLIEATSYQKLLETNPTDMRLVEKAIEKFNAAINAFPNYRDAHIARADFLIKYKGDYIGAITDYDALTSSAVDTDLEMPGYYAKKAKYKDMAQNFTGAIEDYTKSISLNTKADSFYFDRGELFYRLNKFEYAQKDLDTVILLNEKNKQAFYYRGLNFVKLKNNYKAGLDFVAAEKLGISLEQSAVIDSISAKFLSSGQSLVIKHDFANADSAFNDALKIRNCNAAALHGKAEIRFITANELMAKHFNGGADAKFRESIALNNQAISCKPFYSDAFFKNGLAHQRINEPDLAIANFSDAIRTDSASIQAFVERGNTQLLLKKYVKAADNYIMALLLLKTYYARAKKGNNATLLKEVTDDQSKVHALYGQALYFTFDYSNALISLNQALDLNENNSDALYYRGRVYYDENEVSKAIKDFDQALKIHPHYLYYYAKGLANYKAKNYSEATMGFNGLIQLDTLNDIKNKYYLRGLSNFKNNLKTDALNDFTEYSKSETAKTDSSFYTDYGLAQLYADQDSLAAKSFNQAIILSANMVSANSAKALFGLGCYHIKNGRFTQAMEYFEKAFASHQLTKASIKPEEESFFAVFKNNKENRNKYSALKKTYLND